jgi:pimeloyl-ACP methyl ester carboxylesterase
VEPYLRRAGHDVLRPSPTGLGDRVHLRHPGVTMETHVEDVVKLLEYEGVRDGVLVGWSYGGGPSPARPSTLLTG